MTIDKRINFQGGGMSMGNASNQKQSASKANTTSRNTSSGTGGSKGNLGGGGGGQGTDYRQYSPPTAPTYTSSNIDQKPVTGDDYRISENEFINNFNQNEASRFEPTFFNRNYNPITLDQFGSSNQPPEYGNLIAGGLMSLINPALGRVYSGYNFLKDMVPQFNQDVRSTPQMFKFDPTNFNKIDNGLTGIESIQTVGSNSLDTNNGLQGMTIQEIQELINNANSSNLSNTQGSM